MRITDGKVPASELGHMIKRYNFTDIVSAYAAYFEEPRDNKHRIPWIKYFLNNREKDKKELESLKERYA
jgi:hypothetical protein